MSITAREDNKIRLRVIAMWCGKDKVIFRKKLAGIIRDRAGIRLLPSMPVGMSEFVEFYEVGDYERAEAMALKEIHGE